MLQPVLAYTRTERRLTPTTSAHSTETMPRIRIRDLTERGFLAFDLLDLLELLGESARASRWKCSVDECIATDDEGMNLEEAYNQPQWLAGSELFLLAGRTRQVIDGKFEAFHPGEERPWITLEAIDSSYWEVSAADVRQLSRFETRFREVDDIGEGGD